MRRFRDADLPGFGVRVYPSGSKVYVAQTRAKGKSKRVTIGRHGVLTAEQARQRAALIIARVKSGEDPVPAPMAPKPPPRPTVTATSPDDDGAQPEYVITPMFVSVTPGMKLVDHDGREA